MPLRRHFENLAPALKTVVSRRKRGVYNTSKRPLEPSVRDERGQLVRSIGKAQTFLTEAQIDEVVKLYKSGTSMEKIAQEFRAHRRTIAAHLTRRGRPIGRYRRIPPEDREEASELYKRGMTLAEVGSRYGVSQAAARTAVRATGAAIRPRGRMRTL